MVPLIIRAKVFDPNILVRKKVRSTPARYRFNKRIAFELGWDSFGGVRKGERISAGI